MPIASEDPTYEYLSNQAVTMLNHAQQVEYALYRAGLIDWMRERGKEPNKEIGLSESSVENYARRHHQLIQWLWELTDYVTAAPKQHHADVIIIALDEDTITQQDGSNYSGLSKRKFSNVPKKWFEYRHYK